MPITGYDVSKSGCCPSSEEGFAAKTGYAESELRDARSRLSPSADSSFKPSTSRGFCSTKTSRFYYPKNGYPAKEPKKAGAGRKTIVSGSSSNPLFDPV